MRRKRKREKERRRKRDARRDAHRKYIRTYDIHANDDLLPLKKEIKRRSTTISSQPYTYHCTYLLIVINERGTRNKETARQRSTYIQIYISTYLLYEALYRRWEARVWEKRRREMYKEIYEAFHVNCPSAQRPSPKS